MLSSGSYKEFDLALRKGLTKVMPAISVLFLASLFFVPLFNVPSLAQVMQEIDCTAPLTTNIDANYQGPIVVDAYWVDQGVVDTSPSATNPIKKEAGPGEGAEVFAVVLNNKGNSPLNSVVGYLNLPAGFSPTGESKIPQLLTQYNPASKVASNYALASYYGQVPAGGTFILFFNVNILDHAKVGTFGTNMVVNYKIGVGAAGFNIQSCTSALLEVPLVLPGKVVMDLTTNTPSIAPAQADSITINIANKGSAPATGVIATITNLGQKGNTGSGSGGSLTLTSTTTNIVNLGSSQFNLGNIPPGGSRQIMTTVFPATSASGQTQNVSILLTYENAWGKQMSTLLDTGLTINPMPPESLSLVYLGNNTLPEITSGILSDLNFAIENNSTREASNVIISLVPQSTSVSVVGKSTWTIPKLAVGERQFLSTKVFAANSLIDTPTSFTLTANYIANSQAQTNSLSLGTFVVGNIKLHIFGLSVSNVGHTPQISGTLLNEGSTTALFSTIKLSKSQLLDEIKNTSLSDSDSNTTTMHDGSDLHQAQAQSDSSTQSVSTTNTQQFLGDLTSDSPIPFSIPLKGLNHLHPGSYKVSFKITYADDLKNFHDKVLTETIHVTENPQPETTENSKTLMFDLIPSSLVAGVSIIAGIGAVIVIKRKISQNHNLKLPETNDGDIITILGSQNKKQDES